MDSNIKGEMSKDKQKLGSQVQIKRKQVIASLPKSKAFRKGYWGWLQLLRRGGLAASVFI